MSASKRNPGIIAVCVVVLVVALIKTAWVCDDAYITFRTVDQFVSGRGLIWNPDERVQSYTHPLWMFLLSGVYAATGELFYSAIALGIAFTAAAMAVLLGRIAATGWDVILATAILVFSKSFVEYGTSGLENPVTHLLCAVFLWRFLAEERFDRRAVFELFLWAGLAACNRVDTVLLLLPALVWTLVAHGHLSGIRQALKAFSPFWAWCLFSLFYYGFAFPNTAYAKLNTGIDELDLIAQGVIYLLSSLNFEPLTLMAIAAGVAIPIWRRDPKTRLVASGIALYLLYIVWIGGDFMSGRFLTAPLFCSVALLAGFRWPEPGQRLVALVLVLIFGVSNPYSPLRSTARYANLELPGGVADERGYYFKTNGLVNVKRGVVPVLGHRFVLAAEENRSQTQTRPDKPVVVREDVGMYGFFSDPGLHIVDDFGLVDPLLARLPSRYKPDWRIGHFARVVPEGYEETLRTGSNRLADPKLAEYYDKLALITRGPLWSVERLVEIAKMNLGFYDRLVDRQRYRYPDQRVARIGELGGRAPAAEGDGQETCQPLPDSGIRIRLEAMLHTSQIAFYLDSDDSYRAVFYQGERKLAARDIPVLRRQGGGVSRRLVDVPEGAFELGYDAIALFPVYVEKSACIGRVKLLN